VAGGVRRAIYGAVLLTVASPVWAGSVWAGEADVIGATAALRSRGLYDFDVTIRSNDTGWDRYADRFEVLGPDGALLGTRVLDHPHETEQPFTRELSGVRIPGNIERVTFRAHFKPVGFDGATFSMKLPAK
jgi:hypothetical protein